MTAFPRDAPKLGWLVAQHSGSVPRWVSRTRRIGPLIRHPMEMLFSSRRDAIQVSKRTLHLLTDSRLLG